MNSTADGERRLVLRGERNRTLAELMGVTRVGEGVFESVLAIKASNIVL